MPEQRITDAELAKLKDYKTACVERCPDGCGAGLKIDINRLRKVEDGQIREVRGGLDFWRYKQPGEEYSEPPMHITGYTDYTTFNVPNTWLPCTAPTRDEYEAALIAEIEAKREKIVLKTLSTDHHTSGKHEGCHVFSWAGERPKFCPQCGREISWK